MSDHVHPDSTIHWGRVLMTHHLAKEHGMTVPMTWDNGMLHQKHLEAHTQTEEQPMTQTVDTDDLEKQARHLWMETHDKRVPSGWDTLAEETKTYWRRQVQLRADRDRTERIDQSPGVARDRLIAAMLGIDFDRVWALDENVSMRGAARKAVGAQAERLLEWIEKGGILAIPVVGKLGEDYDREQQMVMDLEEINNQLRREAELLRTRVREEKEHSAGLFQEMGALRDEIRALTAQRDDARREVGEMQRELDSLQHAAAESQHWQDQLHLLQGKMLLRGAVLRTGKEVQAEENLAWARRFAQGGGTL